MWDSNRAFSQEVFLWLGRRTWPNWISAMLSVVWIARGKAVFRSVLRSRQSMNVSHYSTSESASSETTWVIVEAS